MLHVFGTSLSLSQVKLTAWKPRFGIAKMAGKGYVDGKLAVEVKEFTFALVKDKEPTA